MYFKDLYLSKSIQTNPNLNLKPTLPNTRDVEKTASIFPALINSAAAENIFAWKSNKAKKAIEKPPSPHDQVQHGSPDTSKQV